MALFVSEVLASQGNLGREDLSTKINKLVRRVDEIKIEVQETLDSRYLTFFPCLNETLDLSSKVTSATNEIDLLRKRIDTDIKNELQVSTHDIEDLSNNLIQTSVTLQLVEKLLTINQALEAINENLRKKEYLLAAQSLGKIQKLLRESVNPCEKQLQIFQTLKIELVVRREKLTYDLGEIWNTHITWDIKGDERKPYSTKLNILLPEDKTEMSSLLKAMHLMNYLDTKLRLFSQHFMTHICKPIITHCVDVVVDEESNKMQLKITTNNDKNRPTFIQVFSNLKLVFQFLNKSIFNLAYTEKNVDHILLMTKLGEKNNEDFCDLLIKECLTHAIPSRKDDLQNYQLVIQQTEELQAFLVEIRFLTDQHKAILDYARNVDVLFANKMCNEILEKARKLMLLELHETVQINSVPNETPDCATSVKFKTGQLRSENKLENVFTFPNCKISKSVDQLLNLVYETLQEATETSPMCCVRLFCTARNIFELFCDVVPLFHKDNLAILPQVAALHHNNCMYIGHHLTTMGHQSSIRLPSSALGDNSTTFVDLVPRIRSLGTEIFLSQMLTQKNLLIEIIRNIGGFHNLSTDVNFIPSLERALKQCLHQLSHLQRVWQPVLPTKVYNQSIGCLCSSILEELIIQVTNQEDIPSHCTSHLTNTFSLLVLRLPALFESVSETKNSSNNGSSSSLGDVCCSVPKWMKFKELLVVLAASMNDILERWAEGKGPLAHEFTAFFRPNSRFVD